MKKKNHHHIMPVLLVALIILGGGVLFYSWRHYNKRITITTIPSEIKALQTIFKRIQERCIIVGFDLKQTPINFLNVKSFSGTEVGDMKLRNPELWEGPYVKENPSVNGVEYQIVSTKNGYFIVPGNGVVVLEGKKIGTDIMVTADADIKKLVDAGVAGEITISKPIIGNLLQDDIADI